LLSKRNIRSTVKFRENKEKANRREGRSLCLLSTIEITMQPVISTANEKRALKLISRF